ncbi:MBL fold metallo-hydrolase [Desulfovibrio mangrovi]|uniref:MBL fold metallo-hydrolase n=1 Tax=Desulfovibrio mangrovi TaxID=2976983 RepID=UPI002247B31A|nr:MBL fold metallo-hydrolase [Desulfovibrio mangrovi]UZP68960.1 MBL fold metallo-hydrolase [Desulfovibrio mangrovi]
MQVKTFPLGPLDTNCHLAWHDGLAVAVDPGGDPARVVTFLEKNNLKLTHILNTHLHFDHIYGNQALQEATGAPILACSMDAYMLDSELGTGGMWGFPKVTPFAFETIEEGDHTFMGLPCKVLHTPGHSPGSLSFYFPDGGVVFVGDLLFYRSIGRTDFPGGSLNALKGSVTTKIFTLPKETVVYSGHGPETAVGDEQLNNPFFTEFVR